MGIISRFTPTIRCPTGALRQAIGVRMGSHCWTRLCVTLRSIDNHEISLTCFASWQPSVFLEIAALWNTMLVVHAYLDS